MCDIWKVTESPELSAPDLDRHVQSISAMGVQWAVFSGGEPLMHSDLFRLCEILRSRRIRTTVLSTGLLLKRNVSSILECVDDLIVSLDGPEEIHDSIRRIPGAFRMLAEGIAAIKSRQPDFPVHARCTVQRTNCRHLNATVTAARQIGIDGISFLAADLTSEAFNRPGGWPVLRTEGIALSSDDLVILETELLLLGSKHRYVAETPDKLTRIAAHFRAHIGQTEPVAPPCNAPWVSVVVEADGTVRPCFFHRSIGRVDEQTSLGGVINSERAIAFRTSLDVSADPICSRCVCSLNWKG